MWTIDYRVANHICVTFHKYSQGVPTLILYFEKLNRLSDKKHIDLVANLGIRDLPLKQSHYHNNKNIADYVT